MAKLRHIAVAVPDPHKAARFYSEVFGLTIVEPTHSPIADGVYLSDGTICLALLNYKTDEAAGLERGKDWIGTHHFGFWCDDLDAQRKVIHDATEESGIPDEILSAIDANVNRDPKTRDRIALDALRAALPAAKRDLVENVPELRTALRRQGVVLGAYHESDLPAELTVAYRGRKAVIRRP